MKKLLLVVLFCCSCYAQSITKKQTDENVFLKKVSYVQKQNLKAKNLYLQGEYTKALLLTEKIIKQAKKDLGINHPDTLFALSNQGYIYYTQGKYKKAEPLLVKSFKLCQKFLGKQHPQTLSSIGALAELYNKQGKYNKAETYYLQCLPLMDIQLGKKHYQIINFMGSLGELYYNTGKYKKAESIFLECNQRIKENPSTLQTLSIKNNLAALYQDQGEYKKSESFYLQCLEEIKPILEENNSHKKFVLSTIIGNLGKLYERQGEYKKAESSILKSIALREAVLNKEHPAIISSKNNLAVLYSKQGKYKKSETLLIECLKQRETKLGENHHDTLTSLTCLAQFYYLQGRYQEAEPLILKSLELKKSILGQEHLDTLISMNDLAKLRECQGKYHQAENIFSQCFALLQKIGKKHPDTLTCLDNLAGICEIQGKNKKAINFYTKCLKLRTQKLGESHPDTLTSMNNLAFMYIKQGQYENAKILFVKCQKLSKDKFEKNNPLSLSFMHNLAYLYYAQKKYDKAELAHLECLQLQQKVLPKGHPNIFLSMKALVLLYCKKKNYVAAQKINYQRIHELDKYLYFLVLGSNKNVQTYFLSKERKIKNLSHSINLRLNNKDSIKYFIYFSLTHKGFLFSMSSKVRSLNIQRESSEIQNMFHEWNENQRLLSHLLLSPPKELEYNILIQRQKELKETIDKLERKLGLLSSRFKNKFEKIELQDIQNNLNKKEVVIDFLIFDKMNLDSLQYTEKYMIASIIQQNKISLVPIGSFTNIEKTLDEYRKTMSSKTKTSYSKKLSQKLYNLIWQPLSPHLKNVKNITIVPDAELHMLPFVSLCDEDGKYLIEKIHLETCSSLRQIALDRETITNKGEVVLFSNPNYDNSMDQRETLGLSFSKLPGTAKESKNIAKILASKNLSYKSYELDQATKQNLLQVKNPQILHLATHGFYLKPEKEQGLTANPFFLEKERGTANIQIFEDTKPQTNIFFDPLTYCGLAFAGANNSSSEKSILLGTEIPSLSLWNTELVVLSACETGVGTTETVTSEGKIYKAEEVYSLRRAFEEAGARAVLSTMWPAHDDATQKFMTRFYELYLDKVPPQQALRAVQLEFLKDSQYSHPYYWANFVLVGTDKHFPEHTEKVKSPKEDSYMNIAMICLRIITIIIVIVFCLIKIIQLRRSDVAKARLARKQKRIKGRESK